MSGERDSLECAWNKTKLRHGDMVRSRKSLGKVRKHKNTWTVSGLLRISFSNIGKSSAILRTSMEGTSHVMQAIATVAGIAFRAQERALSKAMSPKDNACQVVIRGHDSTTVRVVFGDLQDKLMPHARYLLPDHDHPTRQWRVVSYEEYREARPHRKPVSGLVELFAQETCISWVPTHTLHNEVPLIETRNYLHAPCVLERSNASTIFRALELTLPHFDLDSLRHIARVRPFIFLSEVPDRAKANDKKRAFYASLLPPNVFYFMGLGCIAHIISRIMTKATRESDTIGDVHAVWYTCGLVGQHNKLAARLWRHIQDELSRPDQIIAAEPDEDSISHRTHVISHTLLRDELHVHAGHGDCVDAEPSLPLRSNTDKLNVFNAPLNGSPPSIMYVIMMHLRSLCIMVWCQVVFCTL